MAARILELIDKVDNKARVRDQLAGILKLEGENQEALAQAASLDPRDWRLRVYTERSQPWNDYLDQPDEEADAPRIVNVEFDSASYPGSSGNVVSHQKCSAVYNFDCFGMGIARPAGAGHRPADMAARESAERTMMLVRNILMSAQYVQLGLPGVVTRRWVESEQTMDIPTDDTTAQAVAVARLRLVADFPEFSPQHQGQPMESALITITRQETGEVYLQAQYP